MEKQNKRQQWLDKRYGELIEQDRDENLKKVGEKGNVLKRPIHKDDDKTKDLIGHEMRVDPYDTITIDHPKKKGEELEVYQSPMAGVFWVKDCNAVEEFMNEHKELMDKLYKKYGNLLLTEGSCPKYNPHLVDRDYKEVPGYENLDGVKTIASKPYEGPKKSKDASENIKRQFFKILRKYFGVNDPVFKLEHGDTEGGVELREILQKRLLPQIIIDDKRYSNLKYTNKFTNRNIDIQAHNYFYFLTQNDFKKTATLNAVGKEVGEIDTTYIARQYVSTNSWNPRKKADNKYEGKTEKRKLDKRGLAEKDYNVLTRGDLNIKGEMVGDNDFQWTITYQVVVGKKRPEDKQISQDNYKVVPETKIRVTKNIQVNPGKDFDDKNTIAGDVSIMQGAEEVFEDFKNELVKLNPKMWLKYSNMNKMDVERVNESTYNKVMSKLLGEAISKL